MKIAFAANTWEGDSSLAKRLATQLQQHHPGAAHLFVGDGIKPEILGAICIERPRQKILGQVDRYSFRLLALALEHCGDFDYLIQLDPDCWIHRPLVPIAASWFGATFSIRQSGQTVSIMHGSCWGMARTTVETLVAIDPFRPSDYEHKLNHHTSGSCSDDIGFSAGVRRVCPRALWQIWPDYPSTAYRPGMAVEHPVKG